LKSWFTPLLFSFLFHFPSSTLAAPCCGANLTIPSIITSEDKAQISLSYTYSKIYADVFTNQNWKKRSENDLTYTYKLDGAHIFKDRWQAGFSIPFQKRERDGAMKDSSQGLGDLSFQLGYEFLPDWDYNPYRPKGIAYLLALTPTGRSIYESKDGSGIDARGRGFWGAGGGIILIKKWAIWDANLNSEMHYSFPKTIHNNHQESTLTPSYGGNITIGAGANWEKWRLGLLAGWFYEGPVKAEGNINSTGELKRFTNAGAMLSYMLLTNQSLVFNYTDQTLLASPYNTSLSKSFTLFYQMRWER